MGKAVKGAKMSGKAKISRRLWRLLAVGFLLSAVLAPAAAWAYPDPTTQATTQNTAEVKAESSSGSTRCR